VRKLSAHLIFTLTGNPLPHGIITVDENGLITAISAPGEVKENHPVDFYDGIIVPGFVNAHCHLELSHLKDVIPSEKGIGNFIGEIFHKREAPEEVVLEAAANADNEMFILGVSGAGDISNSALTARVKKESRINYLTFIEVFGFHPDRAAKAINTALSVKNVFDQLHLRSSIVPHAPYSVSHSLFQMIYDLDRSKSAVLSMHNQESRAENRFFRKGDGPVKDHIEKNLRIDTSFRKPTGKNSLESVLGMLDKAKPLLLVHNTFTTGQDLRHLGKWRSPENTWLVICANSNLYIEKHLPPVNLFRKEGMRICLGTDSLASNHSLSPVSEMITLQQHFPEISLQEMLTWACLNGAQALGMEQQLGSIEIGKKPGLVFISQVDLKLLKLTGKSRSQRVV
jgi:cytosine/adenosine deaminase-related metal-dependent hydrolase